jgi:hypothetical protein
MELARVSVSAGDHGAVSSQSEWPAIPRARLDEEKISNLQWELATALDRSSGSWAMSLRLRRGPTNRTRAHLANEGDLQSRMQDLKGAQR